VLPLVGQLISRSKDNAYRYLPASVMEFPAGEALANRLRGHGLTDVRWFPMTFGIATLYVGTKNNAAIVPHPSRPEGPVLSAQAEGLGNGIPPAVRP
jgi:hypothetical protein